MKNGTQNSISAYGKHVLAAVVFFVAPIVYWVLVESNPFIETYRFALAIESDKVSIFLFVLFIVSLYLIWYIYKQVGKVENKSDIQPVTESPGKVYEYGGVLKKVKYTSEGKTVEASPDKRHVENSGTSAPEKEEPKETIENKGVEENITPEIHKGDLPGAVASMILNSDAFRQLSEEIKGLRVMLEKPSDSIVNSHQVGVDAGAVRIENDGLLFPDDMLTKKDTEKVAEQIRHQNPIEQIRAKRRKISLSGQPDLFNKDNKS